MTTRTTRRPATTTRRKAARKQQSVSKRSRSKAVKRQPVRSRRNARRGQLRWMRQLAGAALFAGSVVVGFLFTGPAIDFATRVDPNSRAVTEIAVQGLSRLDANAVAEASGIAKGGTRADVDPQAVSQRIEQLDWVRSARVLKPPLGPLVVRVEERTPEAVLKNEKQKEWLLVDGTGTPFAAAQDHDIYSLPHVSSEDTLPLGSPNTLLAQAVSLGHEVQRNGLLAGPDAELEGWYPELRIPSAGSAEGWIIAARGRALQAVLGFDRLEQRLGRLAKMLTRAPKELEGVGQVDLRFDDHAVVRLEK